MAWRSCRRTSTRAPSRSTTSAASSRSSLVGALILAINFAPVPNEGTLTVVLARDRRRWRSCSSTSGSAGRANPLYDLEVAARPPFWVAACAGIIVFGSLMGAMFIGQQFLQNVLGYSTLQAGAAILPAAFCMVLVAPRSAKIVEARGARFTLLFGYVFVLLGFLTMLLLWKEDIPYWKVGLGYALVGIGVGLAGTPASHSLTGSVPVRRVGMASGTADLQRDLGGAIMQSIFGALLTAGYAAAAGVADRAAPGKHISDSARASSRSRFDGAEAIAQRVPALRAAQITAAREDVVPAGRPVGLHWPASSRCCSARRSSTSASPGQSGNGSCWPPMRSRTPRPAARRSHRRLPRPLGEHGAGRSQATGGGLRRGRPVLANVATGDG